MLRKRRNISQKNSPPIRVKVVSTIFGKWIAAKKVAATQTAVELPNNSSQRVKKNDCSMNSCTSAHAMYCHARCMFGNSGFDGTGPPNHRDNSISRTEKVRP